MNTSKIYAHISGQWIGSKTTDTAHQFPKFYKENWNVSFLTEDETTVSRSSDDPSHNTFEDALAWMLSREDCPKHYTLVEVPHMRGSRDSRDILVVAQEPKLKVIVVGDNGYWGKADDLTQALKNAYGPKHYVAYVADERTQVSAVDGGLTYYRDGIEPFVIDRKLSPEQRKRAAAKARKA